MRSRIDDIKSRLDVMDYVDSLRPPSSEAIVSDMDWLLVRLQGAKTCLEAIARCNDNKFLESGLLPQVEMARLCLENLNEVE